MKRTLLTILPIAAAILLATSCSKDSDTDDNIIVNNPTPVETQNIASPAESNAIPFSIKVVTNNDGLSKIGYDDADGKVTPSFTADDVTAKLAMTISEGTTELGTLTLQDADGNFSGTLTTEPAEDATLTATITTTGDATSSTVSITDLMANCAHTYTGLFKYKTDTKVMLTDDKAYIEIFMSPLQHNIDVTIGTEKQNFAMSDDGKVWIAVDGGTKFTMNFTNEKTTTAGKITTIDRSGFVDLGISDGILWADKNIGASNVYDDGNYYAWGEITTKDNGYSWDTYKYGNANNALTKYCNKSNNGKDGFTDELTVLELADDIAYQTYQKDKVSMPTTDEFAALKSSCYWVWTNDYSGKKGYIVYKNQGSEAGAVVASSGTAVDGYSTASDTHIFLPAAGWRQQSDLYNEGTYGYYWSASLRPDLPSRASNLVFHNGGYVSAQMSDNRFSGRSVRAVRRK